MDLQRSVAFLPVPPQTPSLAPVQPFEFVFGTDTHDDYALVDKFISETNARRPAFVLQGGDMTDRGTLEEHRIVESKLRQLEVPFVAIPGNHEYKGAEIARFEGQFGDSPRSFDFQGVHFVLLDNANAKISEETFKFLEQDLEENKGKTTIVAMHVPPVFDGSSGWMQKLHDLAPGLVISPKVEDPSEVKRFTDLMSKYHVNTVLSGHTHIPSEATLGGVHYVVAGSVGGKIGKAGLNHEYLSITVQQGQVNVKRIALDAPVKSNRQVATDTVDYLYRQSKDIRSVRKESNPLNAVPGTAGVSDAFLSGGMMIDAQREVADTVVKLSQNPRLAKLGYDLYGKATMPKADSPTVENVSELTPKLVRGAQPTESGFKTLKQQGVKTIINLRPEANWEAPMVKAQGLNYIYMPLPAVGAPTVEQAMQFLDVVTNPANGKVFFHCQHGSDRTGAMAAAYRIAAQGWTVDQAIAEMRQHGFHEGFEDAKLVFVRQFAAYWKALPNANKAQALHRSLTASF